MNLISKCTDFFFQDNENEFEFVVRDFCLLQGLLFLETRVFVYVMVHTKAKFHESTHFFR